jgi:hypothetical protein
MSRVSVKAVLIGGIVDIVASLVIGLLIALYAMCKFGALTGPSAQATLARVNASVPLRLAQLAVGLLCSLLGGYVAGWVAKHDELLNAGLSAFLCVALGIWVILSGIASDPLWLQVLLLVASPGLAVVGGELRRRHRWSPA